MVLHGTGSLDELVKQVRKAAGEEISERDAIAPMLEMSEREVSDQTAALVTAGQRRGPHVAEVVAGLLAASVAISAFLTADAAFEIPLLPASP